MAKEKDLRALIKDEDKDSVVQNTMNNQLNKELTKMEPTERFAVAGPAIDEEIAIARDTGQIDEQTAQDTLAATKDPKKYKKEIKKSGVKSEFLKALTFFAPQAIGMAIGGAIGGNDGAVAGGDKAQSLTQGFRSENRAQEKHESDLANQGVTNELKRRDQELRDRGLNQKQETAGNVKRADQILHKTTGETLFTTKDGKVMDQSGKVVPPEFQRTVIGERADLAEIRSTQTDQRIGLAGGNLGQRIRGGDRQDEKFIEAKRQKDELSDVQLQAVTDFDEGLETVSRIRSLASNVDTGPIAGRLQSAAEPFGQSSAEFTKLKAATGKQLSEFIKSISGAAVSEQEAVRLAKLIPVVNDNKKVFFARLDEFERNLKKAKEAKLTNLKKFQGKSLPSKPKGRSVLERIRAEKARRGQ